MKLTDKEKEIFHAAQLCPRLSTGELRAASGHRDHSIRYHLQTGLESGTLTARCFVNLHLLGYLQFEIFFSLAPDNTPKRAELLTALINSERVSFLGEVGGEYQYIANVCARTMPEAVHFFDTLSARFGMLILERQIAIRVSLDYFGNKYLSTRVRPVESLSYRITDEQVEIDELDHRILCALMRNDPLVRRTLAQKLGLPLSTVDHRIKRLEELGVIAGYYYLINPDKIGMQSFLLLLGIKGLTSKLKADLTTFAREHPNVIVSIQSIGNWDFEFAIEVEDPRQSVELSQQLHEKFGASLRFVKVLPSFGYPKVSEYPFSEFAPSSPLDSKIAVANFNSSQGR